MGGTWLTTVRGISVGTSVIWIISCLMVHMGFGHGSEPMVSTQQSFQTSLDSLPLVVVADRDRISNLLTSQLSMPCMFVIRETKRKQNEVLHTWYTYLYGWCVAVVVLTS